MVHEHEAPRMWYMNTIVDMLMEMQHQVRHHTDKQTQKTLEAHHVPFPGRVEGGERRFGCTDQDRLRHGVAIVSKSMRVAAR